MAEYTLPDGKILNVPDSATQEDLVNLRKNLAEIYPDHYGQEEAAAEGKTLGSVVEQTSEAVRGIPRGTANTFLSGLKGWYEAGDLGVYWSSYDTRSWSSSSSYFSYRYWYR